MATNGNENDEVKSGEVNMPISVIGEQSLAADMARAEIDQAIATAHRYPRILDTVIKKIETMACYNEAAAENCIYSLPRGGKPIIGASIGFANILAGAWGNCTDAARIVHIDRKEKTVVAEGGFHDLETNRKTIVPVSRRIAGRDGRLFNDDMIMVTGMAAASIARRNAILNAVPRALWFPIYEKALQIVRGTTETFAERKDQALKAFSRFGVTPAQIFMALGLKGEVDLTLEHIPIMRGMYSALRDGSVSVEEMFDPRNMKGGGFETVSNPLGEDDAPAKAETIDKETGEIKPAQSAKPAPAEKKPRGRPRKPEPKEGDVVKIATPPGTTVTLPPAGELHGEVIVENKSGAPVTVMAGGTQTIVPPLTENTSGPQAAGHEGAGPAARARPKNAEEYKAYLISWLVTSTSIAAIEDRWRQDRSLRGDCGVVEAEFAKVMMIKNKRIEELQPRGGDPGPYPE